MRDVSRREGCAIRKHDILPQLESDSPAVGGDAPGDGQLGLRCLRDAVHTNQNPAGQVTDGFGRSVRDQQGVKRLGFGVEAESQLASGLRDAGAGRREQQKCTGKMTIHLARASEGRIR